MHTNLWSVVAGCVLYIRDVKGRQIHSSESTDTGMRPIYSFCQKGSHLVEAPSGLGSCGPQEKKKVMGEFYFPAS